jgi:acetoin utilization deacetylase AcuC-like enzyme
VRAAGLIESADPFADFQIDLGIERQSHRLLEINPISATEADARLVHPQAMIDKLKHACAFGAVLDQGDTPTCPESFQIALLSLGCCLTAADAVMGGRVKRAFSCSRPPGHHAEPDRAMGFCLLSNVAIVARHLQKKYGLGRIAIVDFDVHHGNGTQAAFEDDPSVLFVSLHQHPDTLYPGTGHSYESGDGPGRGTTLNLPFSPGSGDSHYLSAIDHKVLPAIDRFKPQMLLISAGFDAHAEDPLAHIQLTDEGFEQISRQLMAAADAHTEGRAISVLEGGYNLVTLGRSVVRHLLAMCE